MIVIYCSAHPTYNGEERPVADCGDCDSIWNLKQLPGPSFRVGRWP